MLPLAIPFSRLLRTVPSGFALSTSSISISLLFVCFLFRCSAVDRRLALMPSSILAVSGLL